MKKKLSILKKIFYTKSFSFFVESKSTVFLSSSNAPKFSFTYKNKFEYGSRPTDPNEKYSQKTMNKLKADAKEFASKLILKDDQKKAPSPSNNIHDLKSIEDWKTIVIGSKVPIVLDCYADWCQPCKQLTPILERKCIEAKGEWILIKMNIETLPQIATALQLKSVPTVLLINNGNVVDGFTGGDQKSITTFFDGIKLLTGGSKEKQELNLKIEELEKNMLENKKYGEISQELITLLKNEKNKNFFGAKLNVLLGYCSIKEGKKEESLKYTFETNQKFSDDLKDPLVSKYLTLINDEVNLINEKLKGDPKMMELMKKLEENPENNSIRYELAVLQFTNGIFEEAIENSLDILKIQRNWEENKAQKLLINIFEKLGTTNSLVIDGRKKMQRILY